MPRWLQVLNILWQYAQTVGIHIHPHADRHTYYSTTLLSVNSVCSNDSVGLVGVQRLIYLHANINIRAIGSHTEGNCCCVGNSLSFLVTAWLEIAPRSGGGKTS